MREEENAVVEITEVESRSDIQRSWLGHVKRIEERRTKTEELGQEEDQESINSRV